MQSLLMARGMRSRGAAAPPDPDAARQIAELRREVAQLQAQPAPVMSRPVELRRG
jgi:hypothetical protein